MSKQKFLELLFEPGEKTCFTSSPRGTKVSAFPSTKDTFFCINALDHKQDNAPMMHYHDKHVPRRADVNVTSFRNFLIEIDDMPLSTQQAYVKGLVPFSSVVYSGGKSYHFIISLDEPCADYQEYYETSERIAKLVKKLDPSCKNPSRLSRLPNVLRPDTGKAQTLAYLGARVSKQELLDLLPKPSYTISTFKASNSGGRLFVNTLVQQAIRQPEEFVDKYGGRNRFFYWLGNRLREVVNSEPSWMQQKVEDAYANLEDTTGFSIQEAYTAARVRQCQNYDLG